MILDEHRRVQARSIWRVILMNALELQEDPYKHIGFLLTTKEYTNVTSLPHRSREQVDQIIQLMDEHGACDDELREFVYRLFGTTLAIDRQT